MLRECTNHGYFRGESCAMCNEKGRFLMNDEELDSLGRVMAGILRHFPDRFNLKMDAQGFIELEEMTGAVRRRYRQFKWLRPHHIIAIAGTDPKGRYQVEDDRVRATYGHSLELDLELPTDNIPDNLYYPTTEEEVGLLLESGLKPSDRKMVHLSLSVKDAQLAGIYRAPEPIILEINTRDAISAGVVIQRAGTTVFLTREIPGQFIRRIPNDELPPKPEIPAGYPKPRYDREDRRSRRDDEKEAAPSGEGEPAESGEPAEEEESGGDVGNFDSSSDTSGSYMPDDSGN